MHDGDQIVITSIVSCAYAFSKYVYIYYRQKMEHSSINIFVITYLEKFNDETILGKNYEKSYFDCIVTFFPHKLKL